MTGFLRRLDVLVGFRGSFLLLLALVDGLTAWSLANPPAQIPTTSYMTFIRQLAPLQVWAGLWLGVGLVCATYALRTVDWPAFLAAALLKLGWIALMLIGWQFAGVERGWVSASQWLVAGALVLRIAAWPEPERDQHGRLKA